VKVLKIHWRAYLIVVLVVFKLALSTYAPTSTVGHSTGEPVVEESLAAATMVEEPAVEKPTQTLVTEIPVAEPATPSPEHSKTITIAWSPEPDLLNLVYSNIRLGIIPLIGLSTPAFLVSNSLA
jgi:hypothetical protein